MNIISYIPPMSIDPYQGVIAAAALLLMSVRAYVPIDVNGPLIPVWWRIIGWIFAPIMRRLDRLGRSPADLALRAVVVVVIAILFSMLVAQGLARLDSLMPFDRGASLLALMMTLYTGSIWRVMRHAAVLNDTTVLKSIARSRIVKTYRLAEIKDAATLRRVLAGHAAMAIDKMLLLPIVWFLLFGVTGALAAATLAALVWQERIHPPRTTFGRTLMSIDKGVGIIPNWLAGAFFSLATLVAPHAGITRTLAGLNPDQPRVAYERGGYALAAVAWGLRITLAGPLTTRDGAVLEGEWVGPKGSTAQIQPMHLKLTLYWVMVTTLMIMAVLLLVVLASRMAS